MDLGKIELGKLSCKHAFAFHRKVDSAKASAGTLVNKSRPLQYKNIARRLPEYSHDRRLWPSMN